MVDFVKKLNSVMHFSPAPLEHIECDLGWRGDISLRDITALLHMQQPYTYVISRLAPDLFLLSFVRQDDQGILHIQFDRTAEDEWHYKNGADNIESSLQQIIKRMMHLTESLIEPIPLT